MTTKTKVQRTIEYKYREDKILEQLTKYIDSTYNQHYVGKNNIQTIDMWEALDIEVAACQSNILKYAMRYGAKDGYNKKDLLKALHYTILLWHFTQEESEKNETPSLQQDQTN